MNGRTCIFCGASGVTREHVLGDWARRLAGIVSSASARHTFHRESGDRDVDFSAPPLTWVARVVCADCNNGWMSQVEAAAARVLTPLLRGEAATLGLRDQEAVATWAFKTAHVIDAASIGGSGPRFPQSHREWLRERRSPPPLSAAWLTSWPGTTTAWTNHWGFEAVREGETASGNVNAYGATVALGPIVVRVYGATEEPLGPQYIQEPRDGVFQVWPADAGLQWLPRFWLSAEELEAFAYGIPQAIESTVIPGARTFFDPERPDPPPARPA
jgi:hypothetical protein